jgi:ATP:ADP antiporter, AAA family
VVYLIFKYVEKNVLTDLDQLPKSFEETKAYKKSNKEKYSMSQSLSRVSNSKYLLSVAAIVFSFAFINNIVELLWKSQAKMYYTDKTELSNYYSSIIAVIGILSTLSALLVSGNVIRFLGWHTGAIITPIIMCVSTLLFFAMMIFPDQTTFISAWFGYTPLAMIVAIGGIQNCLSRAAKYTLFDTTKELTLLPLKNESKREGKAVVDGIISRFGKSSGSTIYIFSLLLFENMMISVLFGVALCVFVIWTRSIEHINSKISTIYNKYENKEYLTFNEVDQIPTKSIFKRSPNNTNPS